MKEGNIEKEVRPHEARIGLFGCGNIGHIIAKHKVGVKIVAVFDKCTGRAEELAAGVGANPYVDFQHFIQDEFDVVVEAASVDAVRDYGELILKEGKDLIIMSVGALADASLKQKLVAIARSNGRKIRIPTGALFGLDNLKIGKISKIEKLTLRSTKKPASFGVETNERTLLFSGTDDKCIKLYPRNANIAVALSLAAEREVDVELWADPDAVHNTHEVLIAGEFGETAITVNNVPSPDNPATSYLAALSILALLKDLTEPMVIGT